jgi:PAB-dependent poly(A)-specific ribonuclease subunit 3
MRGSHIKQKKGIENMTNYYQAPNYSSPLFYPSQQNQNEYYQQGYYHQQHMFDSSYQMQRPQGRNINNFFMNENFRRLLMSKNDALMATLGGLQQQQLKRVIPKAVLEYHTLYPLDTLTKKAPSRGINAVTETYKALDSNGEGVVLRRIVGWEGGVPDAEKLKKIEQWKSLRHPNVVSLYQMALSGEFNLSKNELIFVYEYCYGSETLESQLAKQRPLPEELLWSYTVQMVSALRAIHTIGAWRLNFEPSKILVMPMKRRLKLNCVGILDVISPTEEDLRRKDIKAMGELLLNLASNNSQAPNLQEIRSQFSSDYCDFVQYLLEDPEVNLDIIAQKIAPKILDELSHLHDHNDYVESELAKELDNGRLFRLMCKIDFVTQHADDLALPIPNGTATITRTDAMVLNLFRDYLFHQSTVPDFSHIVDTLNKLEAGSNEKILLMSRDEQTLLVVGFKDIKRCVLSGFNKLTQHYES